MSNLEGENRDLEREKVFLEDDLGSSFDLGLYYTEGDTPLRHRVTPSLRIAMPVFRGLHLQRPKASGVPVLLNRLFQSSTESYRCFHE